MRTCLASTQRYRISCSASWTSFPGRLPRTDKRTTMCEGGKTSESPSVNGTEERVSERHQHKHANDACERECLSALRTLKEAVNDGVKVDTFR